MKREFHEFRFIFQTRLPRIAAIRIQAVHRA
jgi:hypothetical protein